MTTGVDVSIWMRVANVPVASVARSVSRRSAVGLVPAALQDPNDEWFGLTTRARLIYTSKERVKPGEITTYEQLADPNSALFKGAVAMVMTR